ncbi:MAG: hypothetical protein WC678_04025 [Parcubacteria group bacterium]|jgi:hypothetical protein
MMKERVLFIMVALAIVGFVIFTTPSILISNEDSLRIGKLQSEFDASCDCQTEEIYRQRSSHLHTSGGVVDTFKIRCQLRQMWEINNDIRRILGKYILTPDFLFTRTCKKVSVAYE